MCVCVVFLDCQYRTGVTLDNLGCDVLLTPHGVDGDGAAPDITHVEQFRDLRPLAA